MTNTPAPQAEQLAREVKNQLCIDGTLNRALDLIMPSNSPDGVFSVLTSLAHEAVDRAFAAAKLSAQPSDQPQQEGKPLTDEQIIAIKKASRSVDLAQPWGDTLAFARNLLAAQPRPAAQQPVVTIKVTTLDGGTKRMDLPRDFAWERLPDGEHALFASPQPAPEGFVLMPAKAPTWLIDAVEPTPEYQSYAEALYDAFVLAAAPQPTQDQGRTK